MLSESGIGTEHHVEFMSIWVTEQVRDGHRSAKGRPVAEL
jgi:hypothetical protein